jgi:ribonucleoside-diphosphate reductase alpha chain
MKKVLAELEKPSIAIPVKEKKIIETPKEQPKGMSCPECGEPLIKTNGCDSCSNCGYSKCG